MKRALLAGLTISCLTISPSRGSAQSIKPRPLGTPVATSKEALGSATLARQLPNGSVLVNDAARRRLLLLDPTLQSYTVVADSTAGSVNGYGQRPGALIPYVADSTLYLDVVAGSFLVIDPNGKVTRVMSTPRPNDNGFLSNPANGFPGFDAQGRLVYRSRFQPQMMQTRDGGIQMAAPPDSSPVLRVNLDTRKADTIGSVRVAKTMTAEMTLPNGGVARMNMPVPLPTVDDWAVLSDGSLAIVRGQDYHIDWVRSDGSRATTKQVPYEWRRLTDDDKTVIIDSITKARAAGQAGGPIGGGPVQMFVGGPGGGGRGDAVFMGGAERMAVTQQMVVGGGAPVPSSAAAPASGSAPASGTSSTSKDKPADAAKPAGATSGTANAAPSNGSANAPAASSAATDKASAAVSALPAMTLPVPSMADIPDYRPAFTLPAARPDADANIWIRTSTPGLLVGSAVYDVINNRGELIDRVDVPPNMVIVGFGKGGTVYLTRRDGDGLHLLKANIH